jgi:endoglucanase
MKTHSTALFAFLTALIAVMPCYADTNPVGHPFRGTNAAGGEVEWGVKNTTNPTSGTDYLFISNRDIDYLASKNIGFIRMLVSWECLQPTLNGPLVNSTYSTELQARVAYATSKGMNVLIEPHGASDGNFARWKGNLVGSTQVPNSAFADFWTRMANQYKTNPKVFYGLSNEPHNMSTVQWFNAAQAAINGIRSTGSNQMIFVPGNGWTSASTWTSTSVDTATPKVSNATAWLNLDDPVDNLVASVHMYLDPNGGGGTNDVVSPTIGVERLTSVVNWAKTNHVKVHLSEIGASLSNATAPLAIQNLFDYIEANNTTVIGWSWWAYGPPTWWQGYRFTLCPTSNYTVDNGKMAWLAPYLIQPATALGVPGDANGDGKVDNVDATILATNWHMAAGAAWIHGDFTGDGLVNAADASILAANWGYGVSEADHVPEPGVVAMLVIGVAMALTKRRREA